MKRTICFYCLYWNRNTIDPKCLAIKGKCNPDSKYCCYIRKI